MSLVKHLVLVVWVVRCLQRVPLKQSMETDVGGCQDCEDRGVCVLCVYS